MFKPGIDENMPGFGDRAENGVIMLSYLRDK
jgi:hypothetical protein